jgi:hypothetical protein
MSSVTLQQLRDQARARADMQNSGFISDSELDFYINSEIQELYDLLVTKFEDYYLQTSNFSIAQGSNSFNLPEDFYKMRGVDITIATGQYINARPFNFEDRNITTNPMAVPFNNNLYNYRYQIRGNTVYFLSQPDNQAIAGRLWYVPTFEKLEDGDDTFDGINGYEEYVILGATIRMLMKEESDARVHIAMKQEMKKRIEETAANRDVGRPEKVTDVRGACEWDRSGRYHW